MGQGLLDRLRTSEDTFHIIERFEKHKVNKDGAFLWTWWEGEDAAQRTWEPLEKLYAEVPVMVDAYCEKHKNNKKLRKAYEDIRSSVPSGILM